SGASALSAMVSELSRSGQEALATGNASDAVVIFRRWVYLAAHDPLAHLHLALALEAVGDQPSAHRAFGAARRALERGESSEIGVGMEGIPLAELHKLLEAKWQESIR
ncbi:hypothetical protein JF66_09825, partial [Cryobacterium sp. MLB-32]|uniref:hypothetical protein n=1 Tax=Cryobacterium sp. MLB-32 TaxID=1529318 RepID=UPI0004E66D3B